jgi:hypothetical protein
LLGVTDEFTYTASHSINNERREYFAWGQFYLVRLKKSINMYLGSYYPKNFVVNGDSEFMTNTLSEYWKEMFSSQMEE